MKPRHQFGQQQYGIVHRLSNRAPTHQCRFLSCREDGIDGVDYAFISNSVVVPAGAPQRNLVKPIDDNLVEGLSQ
jgi:hypothetical protein